MWDVTADTELDIVFPLLPYSMEGTDPAIPKKATQAHENKPQMLSDQSTRVSAAPRQRKGIGSTGTGTKVQ